MKDLQWLMEEYIVGDMSVLEVKREFEKLVVSDTEWSELYGCFTQEEIDRFTTIVYDLETI